MLPQRASTDGTSVGLGIAAGEWVTRLGVGYGTITQFTVRGWWLCDQRRGSQNLAAVSAGSALMEMLDQVRAG